MISFSPYRFWPFPNVTLIPLLSIKLFFVWTISFTFRVVFSQGLVPRFLKVGVVGFSCVWGAVGWSAFFFRSGLRNNFPCSVIEGGCFQPLSLKWPYSRLPGRYFFRWGSGPFWPSPSQIGIEFFSLFLRFVVFSAFFARRFHLF